MASEGSVTRWIDLLKAGDHDAVGQLWHRCFELSIIRDVGGAEVTS